MTTMSGHQADRKVPSQNGAVARRERADRSDRQPGTPTEDQRARDFAPYVWAVTRIALGFVFLWAFLDKTFGLGIATPSEGAWIRGGSPTEGYLANLQGTFADQFGAIAGAAWADWLFMAGLLGIGVALTLGIFMRVAAASGALMLVLMWLTAWPLENNPVVDDHLVYALVLVGLAASSAGDTWGLGRVWKRLGLRKRLASAPKPDAPAYY